MKRLLNKIWTYLKSIPIYGYIGAILILLFEWIFYFLAQVIARYTGGVNRGYIPILPMDNSIPFIPFFVIIYVLSYPHWVIALVVGSKVKKDDYINLVIGFIIAVLIGFVIFTAIPTYIDRTKDIVIEQNINKQGFLYDFWRFLIKADGDGGKYGFNMCPSFHCMFSTYVYLLIHREKNIKIGFKIYALIMAILIYCSTVLTKQHYFVDILGGISLAVFSYTIVIIFKPGNKLYEYHVLRKSKKVKE